MCLSHHRPSEKLHDSLCGSAISVRQAGKLYCIEKVNSIPGMWMCWSALKFPFENRRRVGLMLNKRLLILLNIPIPLIGHCPVVNCSSKPESVSWNSWYATLSSVREEWLSDAQSDSCQSLMLNELGFLHMYWFFFFPRSCSWCTWVSATSRQSKL